MNSLANKSAFPTSGGECTTDGMTLRQFAAIEAMKGILASGSFVDSIQSESEKHGMTGMQVIARFAIDASNALLAELAKPSTPCEPSE